MRRNIIIIFISVFILWAWSFAERSELERDGRGYKLQSCSPILANDAALQGGKHTIDITDANCYMIYGSAEIKFREMTSATQTGIQHTIPANTWFTGTPRSEVKQLQYSTATTTTGTSRSDKP